MWHCRCHRAVTKSPKTRLRNLYLSVFLLFCFYRSGSAPAEWGLLGAREPDWSASVLRRGQAGGWDHVLRLHETGAAVHTEWIIISSALYSQNKTIRLISVHFWGVRFSGSFVGTNTPTMSEREAALSKVQPGHFEREPPNLRRWWNVRQTWISRITHSQKCMEANSHIIS